MATNDSNGAGASTPVKLSFGMAKGGAKKPQPMSKPSAFGSTADDKPAAQQDELIKGFEGNKVESLVKKEEKGPLVIPLEENVNWRQQILARRKRHYIPEEESLSKPVQVTETLTTEIQYGLQLSKRTKNDSTADQNGAATSTAGEADGQAIIREEEVVVETREETLEEQAIRRLELGTLGKTTGNNQPEISLGRQENIRGDELEAFQNDLDHLPDEATLDDYEKVPVEEFGAALLRGMGWKGDSKDASPVLYNQRPALLGLGAKPREPEPVTKKYIKPGELRRPAPVTVSDHSSSRSSHLSTTGTSRDGRDDRRSEAKEYHSERPRERERDRRSERERDHGRDRSRERYHDQGRQRDREYERERDRDRDRGRDKDRSDRDRDRERRPERSDRDRERDYRDRDRGREHYERDKDGGRHRVRDWDRGDRDSLRHRR